MDVLPCPREARLALSFRARARQAMPPVEATSRGNARVASSPPSGRPRRGWSGIGEPFGTCSEFISIAEAFEGCPACPRADESRSRAGLAVTARAALRKQASTTHRPSAGETDVSRIVRALRRPGGLSEVKGTLGLVESAALTRGRRRESKLRRSGNGAPE